MTKLFRRSNNTRRPKRTRRNHKTRSRARSRIAAPRQRPPRLALIARIRAQIGAGTYETEDRLGGAIAGLMHSL